MNAGYKQLYCPSCGYRISRESPNTYTTQYDTCELNPRLQFEEYSLNYYKNELELKKQKINELQHRIEILLSEKDEFSFKLDKSRHQVRAIEKDFDKELKQTIRKFEEKENDMRLMISNLKDELDHQTRKYEDSTVFKLNSLRRENENLRMINKNYLDVIETVLPFISKLNEGSKPSLRKKCIQSCELNHVMDNLKEFQSGLKDLQTFLISSSVKQIDNPKEKGIYGFQRKVDELQKDNENLSRSRSLSNINRQEDKKSASTLTSSQSKFKTNISRKINNSLDLSKKSTNTDDQLRCHQSNTGKYLHHNSTHDKIRLNKSSSKSPSRDISQGVRSKCFSRVLKLK